MASGLPSSPNPFLTAQAEPPPPPSRQPPGIESSRSPREAPPSPVRALLPIGRGKSRPGFQLAVRAVRQKLPPDRPRPPPPPPPPPSPFLNLRLACKSWPRNARRALRGNRCYSTAVSAIAPTLGEVRSEPQRTRWRAVGPELRVLTTLPLI